MKLVYALLTIALVIIFVFVFLNSNDLVEETDTANLPVNSIETESQSEMPENEPGDTVEMEGGSDVGMEFPTPDNQGDENSLNGNLATEITIDAFNFGYSQDEIRVSEGDIITINLTNSEGLHDFVIDELQVYSEVLQAGESDTFTFVATEKGTFEYFCSVGNHKEQGMVGTLIVE